MVRSGVKAEKFNKDAETIQWGRNVFSTSGTRIIGDAYGKE